MKRLLPPPEMSSVHAYGHRSALVAPPNSIKICDATRTEGFDLTQPHQGSFIGSALGHRPQTSIRIRFPSIAVGMGRAGAGEERERASRHLQTLYSTAAHIRSLARSLGPIQFTRLPGNCLSMPEFTLGLLTGTIYTRIEGVRGQKGGGGGGSLFVCNPYSSRIGPQESFTLLLLLLRSTPLSENVFTSGWKTDYTKGCSIPPPHLVAWGPQLYNKRRGAGGGLWFREEAHRWHQKLNQQ